MHERERENKKDRFGIYLGTQMSPNFQNSQTLQNLQKPSFGISELTNSKNPKFRKFPKSPKLLLILYGSFRTFGTLRIVEISCERLVLGGWHMCICLLPLALEYNMYIYIHTYIHILPLGLSPADLGALSPGWFRRERGVGRGALSENSCSYPALSPGSRASPGWGRPSVG